MKNFPVFLSLDSQIVVIAGGTELAARKARLILAARADVKIIASTIDDDLRVEFGQRVSFIERAPQPEDFVSSKLAIIAEEDERLQLDLVDMARAGGALVNVVDQPGLCDFTTPSIIDRDDVVVAISTNGKAPVFGRNLREEIERLLPNKLSSLVQFAGQWRDVVKNKFGTSTRAFWEQFFDGPIAHQVLAGDDAGASEQMIKLINDRSHTDDREGNIGKNSESGIVHIIGAGPGDPELLTIRAHRLLQTCDVILYDRLVGDGILSLARRDADRIYVGKSKSNHSMPQEEIQSLMIKLAREGKTVVRLKGGDPFIFGRGGEELDALRAADIPAYVTPGITAATGCAAAAGMALTHRDHAQSVTFVTGHAQADTDPDLDWQALANLKNTLVVYMGVGKAGAIADALMRHGRDGKTPVVVIENGTRDNEIIARGSLETLTQVLRVNSIKGPAMLVIGEVANLADETLIQQSQILPTQLTERMTA